MTDNYDPAIKSTGGRPPLLYYYDVLALTLHYISTGASEFTLANFFGVTQPTVSRVLHLGMEALRKALQHSHDARVEFPDLAQQKLWAQAIMDHAFEGKGAYPALWVYPFCFIDGTFIVIPKPSDEATQRVYMCGKGKSKGLHGVLELALLLKRTEFLVHSLSSFLSYVLRAPPQPHRALQALTAFSSLRPTAQSSFTA